MPNSYKYSGSGIGSGIGGGIGLDPYNNNY